MVAKNTQMQEDTVPKLKETALGLTLVGSSMELRVDFSQMLPRLHPERLSQELLVKAARCKGIQSPIAFDATAGLGEDSLLLAAAGFEVELCEANATIAALLRDGLERARDNEQLAPIVKHMHMREADSVEVLAHLEQAPDVVYLDPMFPERTKSAAVKKKFQLLHYLEAPCSNQEDLLHAAILANPRKIVIKRPAKGERLAAQKPSYSIAGKAVRYDVIIPINLSL